MSEYTLEQLQLIVNSYPSIGKITKYFKFTSGTDNANFYIESQGDKFVVKIYDGMNLMPENIFLELQVMNNSYHAGVKTPHVLETSREKLYTKIGENYAMVMDFVDAQNMKRQAVSDNIVREAGSEVGKMDVALASFTDGNKTRQGYIFDLRNFLNNETSIKLLPNQYSREVFKDIIEVYKEKQKEIWALPKGMIHNDITLHNLLVKNNQLKIIIDFSDIAFNPYIQNLAVVMSQLIFTYNWNPKQMGTFLKAYSQYRPLLLEECNFLYLMTLTRYTTLIVEFNRWNVQNGFTQVANEFVVDNYKFLQDFMKFGKNKFEKIISESVTYK